LVGVDTWQPEHVAAALHAGQLTAGTLEVVLVGGAHPEPDRLAAAGATWCMPEILPGATAEDAVARASAPPG
jgi:hypothetical protein